MDELIIKSKTAANIFNDINEKITGYLSLKDSIIDDDYLEVFSDSVTVIRAISSTYKLISKRRLACFLKGLNLEKEPSFEQLCKLYDYIDSEEKAEFISDSITKVLTANSKKSAFLLGIIIHRLINSKVDLTYKELICANALSSFYDFDIDNIIVLCNYVKYLKSARKKTFSGWFNIYNSFSSWRKDKGIDLDNSHILTVEKCVTAQILIRDIEVELDIDEDSPGSASATNNESFKFTEAGELLLDNLKYLEEL